MDAEIQKYIDARIAKILERALEDDSEWDGTDAAHPAFWRGQKDGVRGVIMRINEILDGKDAGVFGDSELEKVKQRIKRLLDEIRADDQIIANHKEVIELIPECSMHGYCLAHAKEWIKTIRAKTMEEAAEIALQQVVDVDMGDFTFSQDAICRRIHEAILDA